MSSPVTRASSTTAAVVPAADGAARPAANVLKWIAAVDTVVILLHVVNRVSGVDKRLFDLDLEANLPTWVSSLQFAAVAGCAFVLARFAVRRQRYGWATLSAIFAFLSLDELALLHEELVDRISRDPSGDAWFWPVFFVPLGVAALVATAVVVGDVRRLGGSPVLVVASFAILATSLVLDAAATQFVDIAWLFEPEIVLEEACELFGTALLVAGLLPLATRRLRAQPAA